MGAADLFLPLLAILHDAEDDVSVLTGMCRTVRRMTGAEAVAFVSTEGVVVSAIGWDTTAEVAERVPVRYQSETIGALAIECSESDDRGQTRDVLAIAAGLSAPALRARLDAMAVARARGGLLPEMLGSSPAICAVRATLARIAATPFNVLIEGESGTGKELAARAIHRLSARRDRPLLTINCAALGDELMEAELFGHTRGAFTGALGPRAGIFEDAHGGTLFMDEVGELTPRAQAKLLRVLQEGEVRRLGENAPRKVNVRVIAATNRGLTGLVAAGAFREDLLFRLAVTRVVMPPLRERVEDIPALALTFWQRLVEESGSRSVLGTDAIAALCGYPWPGNVRQLQNAMAGLVVIAPERGRVTPRHVAEVVLGRPATPEAPTALHHSRSQWEQHTVASVLARHGGRRSAAARELGLTRQGLGKAIKRLGIDDARRRRSRGVA